MIGVRIPVVGDQFDYVFGLLLDEGALVPEVDMVPVGGAEMVVTEEAWAGLDEEIQREVARFVRPGGDVVAVWPADSDDTDGSAADALEGPRPVRSNGSTTTKGK